MKLLHVFPVLIRFWEGLTLTRQKVAQEKVTSEKEVLQESIPERLEEEHHIQ